MIKGLIFDFDGTIIDTEIAEYLSWQEIYHDHGHDLPLSEWAKCIGASFAAFDPIDYLQAQTGQNFSRQHLLEDHRQRAHKIIIKQPVLPGVNSYLQRARNRGLKLAVASSSPLSWVSGHLTRLGMLHSFDLLCTREDVTCVKPAPDLFLCAAQRLGLEPQEAIAFEDSPNGITAARAAGMYCVAIPNTLTGQLNIAHADLVVSSLADISLDALITRCEMAQTPQQA